MPQTAESPRSGFVRQWRRPPSSGGPKCRAEECPCHLGVRCADHEDALVPSDGEEVRVFHGEHFQPMYNALCVQVTRQPALSCFGFRYVCEGGIEESTAAEEAGACRGTQGRRATCRKFSAGVAPDSPTYSESPVGSCNSGSLQSCHPASLHL